MHLLLWWKSSYTYLPRHECSPQASLFALLELMIPLKLAVMQGMQFLPPSLNLSLDTSCLKETEG